MELNATPKKIGSELAYQLVMRWLVAQVCHKDGIPYRQVHQELVQMVSRSTAGLPELEAETHTALDMLFRDVDGLIKQSGGREAPSAGS